MGKAQEVEVVIAQDRDCALAQVAHKAQHLQGRRSPVHKVADKPQPIPGRIEGALRQQRIQLAHAALHIPDRVGSHSCARL